MQNPQIDAVITWVDGDDPVLAAKRRAYLGNAGATGSAPTRFASEDEVVFCVLSILKHAPFFRHIYIVTDNQTPPVFDVVKKHFPDQLNKFKLISHRDIFAGYEEALPSFNSISISMLLHSIPELADQFVFFNDDFFLVRNTAPEDFFIGSKPVLRGEWLKPLIRAKLALKNMANTLRGVPIKDRPFGGIPPQINSARQAGYKGGVFVAGHVPYPLNRKTLANFEASHQAAFRKNISFRFRHVSQFVTESLANHLELKNNNAIIPENGGANSYVYIDASKNSLSRIERRLARISQNPDVKFLCLQSLDQAEPPVKSLLENWLHAHIVAP